MYMTSPMLTPSFVSPSCIDGSSFSVLLPFVDLSVMTTWEMDRPYPPSGSSVSSTVSSVTSPSYTSFDSRMRRPMARRKCSISISVFFTSELKTSDPTMGQNGTFGPSSCTIRHSIYFIAILDSDYLFPNHSVRR